MKTRITLLLFLMTFGCASAQQHGTETDTVGRTRSLDSVIVVSYINQNIVRSLSAIQGTFLHGGKKTEVVSLAQIPADITNKTGRQVFAKVPGVFVYDMDGAGNQVNIAARGLDPHRGWEFNNRKDGIITNSDMYGYPASHYSMPLESIERIELVRGTGSLQYGAQFGGMLNYISKRGDTTRPFSFESINTIGSYNLLSTYNAIGGRVGKFRYHAYFYRKSRDGYRDNEHTHSEAANMAISYQPNSEFSIRLEWARSKYQYRIPGPLTDSMFHADPRQATRSRNYFSPDIHIPSLTLNWQISGNTRLELISSAVLGRRNSVQYDKPTNIPDTINAQTMQYNNRQVDIDGFNSYTTELRLLQSYRLLGRTSTLVAGMQYMNNDLHRRQMGVGTTGSDYDLSLATPGWGRDVHLKTNNFAFFAENRFQLSPKLSVSPGLRIERGETKMNGHIVYYPANEIPVSMSHDFPLFGVSFSFRPTENMEVYGGWSQAYHPMLFKDLIPSSVFEKVDPNIKDAKGYNAEFGFRGNWRFFRWDVNGFLLKYDDRFGALAETDEFGIAYTYRTNTGNSFTKGIEMLLQADWMVGRFTALSLFTSTALIDARYTSGTVKSGNSNVSIKDNKVESAPPVVSRNGASLRYKSLSISALYSYTAESYADAINTEAPLKTTGAVGLVPSYGLLDLNASVRITSHVELRFNLNNVMDKQYFTKRPAFYPGPGVWSSEGRNANATVLIQL